MKKLRHINIEIPKLLDKLNILSLPPSSPLSPSSSAFSSLPNFFFLSYSVFVSLVIEIMKTLVSYCNVITLSFCSKGKTTSTAWHSTACKSVLLIQVISKIIAMAITSSSFRLSSKGLSSILGFSRNVQVKHKSP